MTHFPTLTCFRCRSCEQCVTCERHAEGCKLAPVGARAETTIRAVVDACSASGGGRPASSNTQNGGNHAPQSVSLGGVVTQTGVNSREWRSPSRYLIVFRNALIGIADSERAFANAAETGAERRAVDAGSAFRVDVGGGR